MMFFPGLIEKLSLNTLMYCNYYSLYLIIRYLGKKGELMKYAKLHPIAIGIAIAIIAGVSTLLMGLFINMFFNGKPLVSMIGTLYITYNPSLLNSALSALIVFVNALIGGYIAAWIYNLLAEYI